MILSEKSTIGKELLKIKTKVTQKNALQVAILY